SPNSWTDVELVKVYQPINDIDLTVKDIKVIQVSEDLPLVAKKKTMVRVDVGFTSSDPNIDHVDNIEVKLEFGNFTLSQSQTIKSNYDPRNVQDNFSITYCKDAFIFFIADNDLPIAGNYNIKAIVDPRNQIQEKDENNNEFSKNMGFQNVRKYKLLYIPSYPWE
ncbi:MAG: hypothetical protein HY817_03870, partial [Candidatus Abawacabacteria bacterium]|nr:hypothetical protein [Candidatus Abawacabacteria bacterium]